MSDRTSIRSTAMAPSVYRTACTSDLLPIESEVISLDRPFAIVEPLVARVCVIEPPAGYVLRPPCSPRL
jgi:hypothetical protein